MLKNSFPVRDIPPNCVDTHHMAFQQPALPPVTRPVTAPAQDQDARRIRVHAQAVEEPQEWILFPNAKSPTHTRTASTDRTPRTAGLSRLSDFGSLNTALRSNEEDDLHCEATLGSADENDELDCLDDGLHAFQNSPLAYNLGPVNQSSSIFPRHDGLGKFQPSSAAAQDQIWHFERHNPRKQSFTSHQRRPSSVKRKLEDIEDEDRTITEEDKRERIERWRLEHSRILLDEIEKETRRRQSVARSQLNDQVQYPLASEATHSEIQRQQPSPRHPGDHEEAARPEGESESFISRMTRRVIHSFIGIDEDVLAVLFGEELPKEDSLLPVQITEQAAPDSFRDPQTWHSRLLHRLARELGILLDQLAEQQNLEAMSDLYNTPSPTYASIPITEPTSSRTRPRGHSGFSDTPPTSPSFDFNAYASLWGIEDSPSPTPRPSSHNQAYWEQSPNLSNLLDLFRTHFITSGSSTPKPQSHLDPLRAPNLATTASPESLRRTALIRQYHPLINHISQLESTRQRNRRPRPLSRVGGYGYTGSSCGSQSLRRSRRGTTITSTTSIGSYQDGSSRNFWDIGASGGSLFGGAWGEV